MPFMAENNFSLLRDFLSILLNWSVDSLSDIQKKELDGLVQVFEAHYMDAISKAETKRESTRISDLKSIALQGNRFSFWI